MYERLITLLLAAGKIEEAFHYAERAKARSFLDLIAERELDIQKGVKEELLQQKQELLHKISRYQKLLLDNPEDSLIRKFLAVEDALTKLERKIKMESPAYADLVYPEPVRIKDVQKKVLDGETALLEFVVTDDNVLCWTITKNAYQMHVLDVKREELINVIYDYRTLLKDVYGAGKTMMLEYAVVIYERLMESAIEDLEGITRFLIVPDGPLHYLPFQALVKDSEVFLLSQYLITYAPSATVLTKLEKRKNEAEPSAQLIAFGNPDFDAEKSTGESVPRGIMQSFYKERGIHFDSLPFTLQEVKNLKAIYKDATIYTKDDAREARAKNECPEYRFVHFATHGILDELEPMYSGVVLTLTSKQNEDGFLQAYEVYNLRLNADLVVLSACQTGLGKLFKGEGVVGLSRAFMYAGTRSIAVSLWSVVDKSTALLMEKFYEHLHDGKNKDEALRQAQLYLLNETEFSLPAFWAPFVLIGDWQ